jgi:hypothetical protein
MEWVGDLKSKIKAFIHGHAQELGIGGPVKSQLMNIYLQQIKSN